VLEALLAKETLAEAVPLACGVKLTVTGALLPAAIVNGNETPLRVNSELFDEAEDTVTLEPVALKVAGMFAVCPTTTLPKFRVAGLTPNCPETAPVPDKEMVRVALEALDVIAMLPLKLPPVAGAKSVPKVKLCPGINVKGRVNPVMLKPEPVSLA